MVRDKNVKLMTRMAIYEKNAGKYEIPMTGYFKGDYVRLNVLKSIVGGTVAFAMALVLGILYKAEYILANVMKMDYKQIGLKIIVVYLVWSKITKPVFNFVFTKLKVPDVDLESIQL